MKTQLTYWIQAGGIAIAAAGLIYKFDRVLAGTFILGGLVFFVGWFLRKKGWL